jgi:uncharacterized protein
VAEIVIIDINTHLGHYPFRRLRHSTPAGLLSLMDRAGISHALVASIHSLFYRDAHGGNEEVAEAVRDSRGRLMGMATINPTYAGWERDLQEAVQTLGLRVLRLAPAYHGYALTGDIGAAILKQAAAYRIPVALSQRIEDRRQRHPWDAAEDLDFGQIAEVSRQHPDLRLILLNWSGLNAAAIVSAGLRDRCLIDISRMPVVLQATIPRLIKSLGADAIAFGSHAPFDYPGPSLIKLSILELSTAAREQIAWRNAAAFLRWKV